MRSLLLLLLAAGMVVVALATHQASSDPWKAYHFSRKILAYPKKEQASILNDLVDFDKLLLNNEQIILYSSTGKNIRRYDKLTKQSVNITMPAQSVTLLGGQIINNSLALFDYKAVAYKVNLESLFFTNDTLKIRYFSRAILVNDTLALVKYAHDDNQKTTLFGIYNFRTRSITKEFYFLEKEDDFGFDTDGFFVRDNNQIYFKSYLNSSVYHFNAQGEFLNKYSEINRFDKKYAVIEKEGAITFAEPVKVLTRAGAVSNGKLFVYSQIKANEDDDAYDYIDSYLPDGKYMGSLAINKPSPDAHLINFAMQGNKLYVLRRTSLECYNLPFSKDGALLVTRNH